MEIMFKKKEKLIKEKKVRTMKVGTHKKSVIALWVLWSSFFVTLVAKKYRLATMLPFVPRMVCDSR